MGTVKNYMELLVADYLDEALGKAGDKALTKIHDSPDMQAEVIAEALNHIPPFYVTCKEGEVYGFSTGAVPQNKADIMVEIAKAIEVIGKK